MDWLSEIHDLGLIVLAGFLGGLLGLEREISEKPAGLRTHIFVGAGSAILMLMGHAAVVMFEQREGGQFIRTDPIRVIQAIVIGIGFLGGGTIVHNGSKGVEGLTTAASIFLTAGIGIAVAIQQIVVAVGTAVFAVTILWLLGNMERRLENRNRERRARASDPPADRAESE